MIYEKMKKIRIGLITVAAISTIGLLIALYLNNWVLVKNLAGIYRMIIVNVCTFTSGILSIIGDTKKSKFQRKTSENTLDK